MLKVSFTEITILKNSNHAAAPVSMIGDKEFDEDGTEQMIRHTLASSQRPR